MWWIQLSAFQWLWNWQSIECETVFSWGDIWDIDIYFFMNGNWRVRSLSVKLQVIVFTALLRSLIFRREVNYIAKKCWSFFFFLRPKSSISKDLLILWDFSTSLSSLDPAPTLKSCYSSEICLYQGVLTTRTASFPEIHNTVLVWTSFSISDSKMLLLTKIINLHISSVTGHGMTHGKDPVSWQQFPAWKEAGLNLKSIQSWEPYWLRRKLMVIFGDI